MERPFRGRDGAGRPHLASRWRGLSEALPRRGGPRCARPLRPACGPWGATRPAAGMAGTDQIDCRTHRGARGTARSLGGPAGAGSVRARCRLRVGAEASRRGNRRCVRIARRSPERTERAPRGERAERGSRVGERSRSGRLRRSAPHGAGGYRGAASRGAEGPPARPRGPSKKATSIQGKTLRERSAHAAPGDAYSRLPGGSWRAPPRTYPRPGWGRAAISRAKAFRASQRGARSGTRAESGESARRRPSPRAGSRWGAGL